MATRLLALQPVETGGTVRSFRMDDRKQRLIVDSRYPVGAGFIGWEVDRLSDLDSVGARVEAAGVHVRRGTRSLADERCVTDLIEFEDPAGHRIEVFWQPQVADDPFVPGRPISGFRTGPLGMGHVVMNVSSVDDLLPFYQQVLGFRVSDFTLQPTKVYFLHVNERHHSFAMIENGRKSFHHVMMELGSLDDVGQGYDLAQLEPERVAFTLGRHTNDFMTSFYARTPSGMFVEYGWGGRSIDPEAWKSHETFDGTSFWGHERLDLPPDVRTRMRDVRLAAAARGVRAPDTIDCPWFRSVAKPENGSDNSRRP